jgi:hypothetical protein
MVSINMVSLRNYPLVVDKNLYFLLKCFPGKSNKTDYWIKFFFFFFLLLYPLYAIWPVGKQ